jgi:LmbE family N-acetylglucosaminyl deacetylase
VRVVLGALLLAVACARRPAPLDVPAGTRLVVVAPHPDDESLAAGGLIQRVLRGGGSVRIVVLTSGDGFREAAAGMGGRPEPSAADYRALGARREAELHAAARILGVRELVLLYGPDDGLDALTTTHWSRATPYVSPLSGRGPFSGEALFEQLRDTLATTHPTLVVAADPRDHHLDHAATGRLVAWALGSLRDRPRYLTYLVHDVAWPPEHPDGDRLPPPAGAEYASTPWVSLELTAAELATKRDALVAHRSQWPTLGGLLQRFLRRNELFAVQRGPAS